MPNPGAQAAAPASAGEAGPAAPGPPRRRLIWPLPLSAFVLALVLLDSRVTAFIVALPYGAGVVTT